MKAKPTAPLLTPFHIRLDPGLRRKLDQLAEADRRNVSDYIRLLLEDAVQARLDKQAT